MELQQAQLGIRQGEDWEVRKADGETVLTYLPRSLTDSQALGFLQFAQRIEQKAFDQGREVGKGAMKAAYSQRMNELADRVRSLEAHNEFLAERLDEHISGASNNGND